MKKKIAIVDNSTWNIYNFRLSLITRLKQDGYRVVVIAPVDEYILYLNESYFTRHIPLKFLSPQNKNPFKDLLLTWELYRIYKEEQPDLILHYTIKPNIFGNIAAAMARIPAISTITGLGYSFLHKGLINRLVPKLYKLAFRSIQKVVFYNPDDLQLFVNRKILPPGKGTIIPGSGVNTDHFYPVPKKAHARFVFLFIGRLLYDKGLREFVEAARHVKQIIPQAECWVLGELNSRNPAAISKTDLLNWIEEKHIRYFGVTRDVRLFIRKADAIVLPSYREGIPRSILEAMAMSKPIITTSVAGCKETVEQDKNGFIVPARDALSLAEAMTKLYHLSAEELNAMGDYSRQKAVEEFDIRIIAKHYLKLIRSIIDSPQNPSKIPTRPIKFPSLKSRNN